MTPRSRRADRPRRPMYARLLRLRYIAPSGLLCFIFLEGAVTLGGLLALAELVSWWGVLVLPVTVAAMVKLNDVVAGALIRPHPPAAARATVGSVRPAIPRGSSWADRDADRSRPTWDTAAFEAVRDDGRPAWDGPHDDAHGGLGDGSDEPGGSDAHGVLAPGGGVRPDAVRADDGWRAYAADGGDGWDAAPSDMAGSGWDAAPTDISPDGGTDQDAAPAAGGAAWVATDGTAASWDAAPFGVAHDAAGAEPGWDSPRLGAGEDESGWDAARFGVPAEDGWEGSVRPGSPGWEAPARSEAHADHADSVAGWDASLRGDDAEPEPGWDSPRFGVGGDDAEAASGWNAERFGLSGDDTGGEARRAAPRFDAERDDTGAEASWDAAPSPAATDLMDDDEDTVSIPTVVNSGRNRSGKRSWAERVEAQRQRLRQSASRRYE